MFLSKGSMMQSISFVSLRAKVFRQSQMMPSKKKKMGDAKAWHSLKPSIQSSSPFYWFCLDSVCAYFRFVVNSLSSWHSLEHIGLPCLSLPGTWIAGIVPSCQAPQFCFKDKCYSSHHNELVWLLPVSHQSMVYYGSEMAHTQKKNNAINWLKDNGDR